MKNYYLEYHYSGKYPLKAHFVRTCPLNRIQNLLKVNPNIYKKKTLESFKGLILIIRKNYEKSSKLELILTLTPALSPSLGDLPDTPHSRHDHAHCR